MALRLAPSTPEPKPSLGERIVQARGYCLWKQHHLIDKMEEIAAGSPTPVNVPNRRTLSSWENNVTSPNVRQLTLIARATGFPPEWFVMDLDDGEIDPGPGGDSGVTRGYLRLVDDELVAA